MSSELNVSSSVKVIHASLNTVESLLELHEERLKEEKVTHKLMGENNYLLVCDVLLQTVQEQLDGLVWLTQKNMFQMTRDGTSDEFKGDVLMERLIRLKTRSCSYSACRVKSAFWSQTII